MVVLNGVVMAVVFFVVRIAVMPSYWASVFATFGTPEFERLGFGAQVAWITSCIALDILNTIWMYKIARGCYKVLTGRGGRKVEAEKTFCADEKHVNNHTDWCRTNNIQARTKAGRLDCKELLAVAIVSASHPLQSQSPQILTPTGAEESSLWLTQAPAFADYYTAGRKLSGFRQGRVHKHTLNTTCSSPPPSHHHLLPPSLLSCSTSAKVQSSQVPVDKTGKQ